MEHHSTEPVNLLNLSKQGKIVVSTILFLLLLVIIAVGYAVTSTWLLHAQVATLEKTTATDLDATINKLQQEINAKHQQTEQDLEQLLNIELKPHIDELQKNLTIMQTAANQKQSTEKSISIAQQVINNFDLNIATRIITLAKFNLEVMQNKTTCLQLLEFCKNWLAELKTNQFAKIITAVEQDIATITAIPAPNKAEIWQTIANMQTNLEQYPLLEKKAGPATSDADPIPTQSAITEKSFWASIPQRLWQGIKSKIKITNHNTIDAQEFTHYAGVIAKQRLKLILEQINFAGSSADQTLYQNNIAIAKNLITTYFVTTDAKIQQALRDLDQLAKISLLLPTDLKLTSLTVIDTMTIDQ